MRRSLVHFVELSREELDGARALIACVELESVRLSRFKFVSDLEARPTPNGEVELSSSSRSEPILGADKLRINFDLGLKGHQENALIIDMSARIEAIYSVPKEHGFTLEQCKSFAKSNGMLNVWPFWREYAQAATIRAGLAPLTLPLFRVIHKPMKPRR